MKKMMLFAGMAFAALTAGAQTYNLTITKTNGQTVVIPTDDVDKIEFIENAGSVIKSPTLLDIVFNEDGTATDNSPYHHEVITKPGSGLMTYYSDIHKCYVANFRNPMGGSVTDSYYRVNYTKGGDFINHIADGCTFETIIKLNETNPGNAEVKWFSSMQAGGIGFLLPIHNASNPKTRCITFLPNCSPAGTSYWRWTYSSVEPQAGSYYHVVGVWNKAEGKSYIYINGQLSGTAAAEGTYVPVANGAESFIIGGDPDNGQTYCTSSWNGEVVTARIYDDPIDAEDVAKLWKAADFDPEAKSMSINDLQYLPECAVGAGYKYTVYGKGFAAGDIIALEQADGNATHTPAVTITEGSATIEIPSALKSGSYRLILKRGENRLPLCTVKFNYSENPVKPVVPKVIAHRGEHTGGASENSIASLKKAMDSGYYGIELDVWITTDNQLVVHHDGVYNGVNFCNTTYNQIQNVTLSNGEKLPTFDSFLSTFISKKDASPSKLIIEIKTHTQLARTYAAIDKVMQMVKDNGLEDRVEYIAFSYDACKRIVANNSKAIVGYLMGDKAPSTVLADGIRSIDYSYTAFGSHPEWIEQGRRLGMVVNVWTVNSASEMLKYTGMGVDYITTDAPATLVELNKKTFVSE